MRIPLFLTLVVLAPWLRPLASELALASSPSAARPSLASTGVRASVTQKVVYRKVADGDLRMAVLLTAGAGAASGDYVTASGGILARDANYKYHTFTNSGTLTVTTAGNVDVLVVGGGGSGSPGKSGIYYGGGGGGGMVAVSNGVAVSTGPITILVGAGGTAVTANATDGNPGSSSSFGAAVPVVAVGGSGGCGASNSNGGASGSGRSGGNGGSMYGGGGGGGDSAVGSDLCRQDSPDTGFLPWHGGNGGAGTTVAGLCGWFSSYGGGGGGGGSGMALGGVGGGGTGNDSSGTENTGGGGAGGVSAGGSGIVIVRYRLPPTSSTIVNGSFEDGLSGWSAVGLGIHYVVGTTQGKTEGTNALYFNGQNALYFNGQDVAGDMVIEQSLITTVGASYTLTFDYWAYGTLAQQLKVQALDGPTDTQIATMTASQTGGTYTPTYLYDQTLTFTAVSAGTTIRFSDTTLQPGSVDCDGGLDNVRLSGTVATPLDSPTVTSPRP